MNWLHEFLILRREKEIRSVYCKFTHIFHNGNFYHLRMVFIIKIRRWTKEMHVLKYKNETEPNLIRFIIQLVFSFNGIWCIHKWACKVWWIRADDAWQTTIVCVHIIVKQAFIEFVSVHQRRQFTYSILMMSLYLKRDDVFFFISILSIDELWESLGFVFARTNELSDLYQYIFYQLYINVEIINDKWLAVRLFIVIAF